MKRLILLLAILVLSACAKVELYHNLGEEDVNELLAVLHEHGITASKKKEVNQNEISWTVVLEPRDIARARSLLLERNLPRKKEQGLGDIYKEKGLIPTPDEQKARFLIGIKGEIINALRKNADVIDADVVLNIPDKENFGADPAARKRPSASLIIKIRPTPEAQATLTESKLQQFVGKSVPDLDPRDVTVIISYVGGTPPGLIPGVGIPGVTPATRAAATTTVSVAGVEVLPEAAGRLKLYLGIFLGLLLLLSVALVVTIIHTSRVRQELAKSTVDGELLDSPDNKRLGPGS